VLDEPRRRGDFGRDGNFAAHRLARGGAHGLSSNPAGFLDPHGCEAAPFRDVTALAGAVAVSDLVLLGGGSIFFDYWGCDPGAVLTPRHQGLSLWTGIALLAAACDKPLMVYGAGVGPFPSISKNKYFPINPRKVGREPHCGAPGWYHFLRLT
jgi:hypothetical protein